MYNKNKVRLLGYNLLVCTALGSPINAEGLACASHRVILCTRVLIMDFVLLYLWKYLLFVLCASAFVNKPINDGLGDYMIHAEIQSEDELTQSLIERS